MAVAVVPSRRVVASNTKVRASGVALDIASTATWCQPGEHVPAGAGAVRLFGDSAAPYHVFVDVRDGRRSVTSAEARAPAGARVLVVDLPRPARTVEHGELCVTNLGSDRVWFAGNLTNAFAHVAKAEPSFAAPKDDVIRADYLTGERVPLWRIVGEVGRRASLFRPAFLPSGAMWLALLSVLAAGVWVTVQVVRGRRLRARAVFTVAVIAAASWALVTPPLQGPDEWDHLAYADYLADHGSLPPPAGKGPRATDQLALIRRHLSFSVEGLPTRAWVDRAHLLEDLDTADVRVDPRSVDDALSSPPLYYAIVAAPGAVASAAGANVLDTLYVMRLASALLAGLTAVAAYWFARETLPGHPRCWPIAGLAVGLHPLVGFMGGSVNNDNLVFALVTTTLAVLARILRRGLTLRLALAAGTLVGLGAFTKTRILLFLPLVGAGLLLGALRSRPVMAGLRRATAGLAVFAVAQAAWIVVATRVFDRRDRASSVASNAAGWSLESISSALSYTWQFFLPRLPFMTDFFPSYPRYGLWDVYVEGFVGRFGVFEFGFPLWVNVVGAAVLGAILVLAMRALAQDGRWRRRAVEVGFYVFALGSVAVLLGITGHDYLVRRGFYLEQTRYLLPLVALYGGVVAAAVLGLPARWRQSAAAALVLLFAGHSFFSLVLTVHRYYV